MSSPDPSAMVIVGAGQAGARAAKAMRAAGYEGRILLYGSEPHLPYERPLLSKTLLLQADGPTPFVMPPSDYESFGIEAYTGTTVCAIDRESSCIVLQSGESVAYEKLLIATGSCPREIMIEGYPSDRILSLRTIDDSRKLEACLADHPRVAVVGGGFIGLEVAATLAARGCSVTVVEYADRLLPRLGCSEASAMVLAHHRATGIDIRLGARIISGRDRAVTLDDGSDIDAELVIAGVGVVPETRLAQIAGLKVDDGIVVDEYGRTSDPHIFAAGDVTRHFNPRLGRFVRLESWENANLQAEAAGRTMVGQPTASCEIPWLWSDQGMLNFQMAGVPGTDAQAVIRGDGGESGMTVLQFDGKRLVGGFTLNRGKEMPLIRRMLASGQSFERPEDLADASTPLRKFMKAEA